MPWHTGDIGIDSLLDAADSVESAELYDEDGLKDILRHTDSIASCATVPEVKAAGILARNRLLVLDNVNDKVKRPDSLALSAVSADTHPYLHARIQLLMAQQEEDLEHKTDMLFSILPDFIDACDSMRVVETLYELNTAYGRVWDNDTQSEYMHEILNYVPDSLPTLRAIIRSNIARLERNRKDTTAYLASLDTLRMEKELMRLAPALGIIVYSDLYRFRGCPEDLDTAGNYLGKLEIEHDASRVYMVQRLNRHISFSERDSASKFAMMLESKLGDEDNPLDMESMLALVPYYLMMGDSVSAEKMERRLEASRRSAAAYERALKMARLNADRRINEVREYSEAVHSRNRVRSVATTAAIVLCIVLLPGLLLLRWIRSRHRHEDKALKGDLENTRRRLTVAQMRTAEKERALSSVLQDLESMSKGNGDAPEQADALRRRLRLQLTGDDDWERFSAVFTEMRPGFVDNLKREYPQLTRGDIRICCLLEMDLDTKHIAQLLMIRPESVKKHRQRLRAKLGITPDVKWPDFFSRF